MKRGVNFFLIFLFVSITLNSQPYLMSFADVSKDNIVFTLENDLWLVPINGGEARRITDAAGEETYAKFSPDGKQLAFTAHYDGGTDVYVMNTDGSKPVRLTYHPADDLVLDWFPDGKHILFRSIREYPIRNYHIYKVSVDGGMPYKLPVDQAGVTSLSPDGKSIVYNRLSREFRTWKRYKGGWAEDLWIGNLEKRDYQKITNFEGTDNWPMWYDGYIYFVSDRTDGTLNLFKYNIENKTTTQLTFYKDYDVRYPSVGPDHIIYQYAEELYLFDLKTEQSSKVKLSINSDKQIGKTIISDIENFSGGFGLSPNGSRVIIDLRGEILNLPAGKGVEYNLTNTSSSREKNPIWSPDGKSVLFISDKTGEEELYLVNPDGGEWKQLTKNGFGFRMQPVWSPDSKYIIFSDKFMKLNLVDAATGTIKVVDQSDYDDAWERWGIQDYVWSPDSRWIAYTKMEQSFYESIFLYSLDDGKSYRVTEEIYEDWSPSFSNDGKYLYFLSNRTYNPVMGFVDQNHIFLDMTKPYLLILHEGDQSPFSDVISEAGKVSNEISTIDFSKRIIEAPVPAGNLFRLEAVEGGFVYLKKTENEFLKYQTVTDANEGKNLDLYYFDLSNQTSNLLISGVSQYHLSTDGKKTIYKSGKKFGVVKTGTPAKVGDGEINLSDVKIEIDRRKEFMQIYNEAWRIQRDWFYDKNMHGVNWEKVGEKYRKFVPYCDTRDNLNYLIGEMISELNIGHTYISGGDLETYKTVSAGYLGVDFVNPDKDQFPQIKRIIPSDNWDPDVYSPLFSPGCPIENGDYILAIDGEQIKKGDNIYKYLVGKKDDIIEITYNSVPTMDGASKYKVKTASSESSLRYNDWVRKNTEYVEKYTNDEVGYVHFPGMMENGLVALATQWYPNYYKKGIIVDARYNTGGFTSKQIVDRIERIRNTMMQPREGMPTPIPERAFFGNLVLLINENTGSDGELFAEAWRYRGFGPIIGKRTWGGAVGIEPHQYLVDGGICTPPAFGEYSIDGRWVIEGRGVEPDIEVNNVPSDVLEGIDAQLKKGLEVMMDKIKNEPKTWSPLPAYPDKSKPTLK